MNCTRERTGRLVVGVGICALLVSASEIPAAHAGSRPLRPTTATSTAAPTSKRPATNRLRSMMVRAATTLGGGLLGGTAGLHTVIPAVERLGSMLGSGSPEASMGGAMLTATVWVAGTTLAGAVGGRWIGRRLTSAPATSANGR